MKIRLPKYLCIIISLVVLLMLVPQIGLSADNLEQELGNLRYDDHVDLSGKTVQIIDAGIPTSYQVGYGVAENTVRDTAVVTLRGDTLIATGIGSAKVSINDKTYDVTVTAAPLSVFLLMGQSNMNGNDGNKGQSVANSDGTAYSTHTANSALTVDTAAYYVPSALTGAYSTVNTKGTVEYLANYPVNAITESGDGKIGMDGAIAYRWNQLTGDKVWTVNVAHGGTAISTWMPGKINYNEAIATYAAVKDTLEAEIAAGHYSLQEFGYFWCQGCADTSRTAEQYVNDYLIMHEAFKTAVSVDHDADPLTEELHLQFAAIIPIRSGRDYQSMYREGTYTVDPVGNYYSSFLDLQMSGPRVAQIWMGNNPELTDIFNVSMESSRWVYMPDGADGVSSYFKEKYPNGRIDYPVQTKQANSWYTPTKPEQMHNSIHYCQVGYNEVGLCAAENLAYTLGRAEAPKTNICVEFVSWDGYTAVSEIVASDTAGSSTLVVPLVSPLYKSKEVSYELNEGLEYNYYDLLAEDRKTEGTLIANGAEGAVGVVPYEPPTPASYRWEVVDGALVSVDCDGITENVPTMLAGSMDGNDITGGTYRLEIPVLLLSDRSWVVEMKCTGDWNGMLLASATNGYSDGLRYLFNSSTSSGLVALGEYHNNKAHNYGIPLASKALDWSMPHVYRVENKVFTDGSNMAFLYVDGNEMGALNQYYIGGNSSQGAEVDWVNGKDFCFSFLGNSNNPLLIHDLEYIQVYEDGYIHAIPENQGVQNAIDRAYALTDVEWTPLADVPGVDEVNGQYTVVPYKAGVTYRGIPYSGVTANDCYVGLNVSLESFLTALKNENSVLYTENLHSTNPKSATYFGTVCSKFAQYVLDVPGSYNTNNVANIPGMDTIAMPGKYTVDQIKLGDVILDVVNHTTVCTDILYDSDGNVAFIEISEAVFPQVRRKMWSPEEFYTHFAQYRLCRYQYIDKVPAVVATDVDANYALMPRFGDKYNYRISSTEGVVNVLESGYNKAVILRDGDVVDEIILNGATSFKFDRSIPGYLEMYLEKADGTRSGSVYACVVESSVAVEDSSEFAIGKLTVTIDSNCGTPLYVQVGTAHAIFCNVEGREGTIQITFPASKISNRNVRVAYLNEYGIFLSNWVTFTADENPSKDPFLSQGQFWNGYNITPSNPAPVIQENKVGYWSYTMIPVEENTTYYSVGATRIWFLDKHGEGISTMNAYKDSAVPFQFTTPAGTAYISIAYVPTLVEQGKETLIHIHNYVEGICVECGAYYVNFQSATISLAGNIAINFYVELGQPILDDESAYMSFTLPDGTTKTAMLSDAEVSVKNGVTRYVFTCEVHAKQMADMVVAQMHLGDGTAVGDSRSYSVVTYAGYIIAHEDQYAAYPSLVNLLKAMLNYGAYSQIHFGYNVNNLANANLNLTLNDVTLQNVEAYRPKRAGSMTGLEITSVTLILRSETVLRFYYTLASGCSIEDYNFVVNGKAVQPIYNQDNGRYYVDVTNIAAKDLDREYGVTVTNKAGTESLSVIASAMSYVYQVIASPSYFTEDVKDVVKAMYAYNIAANAYFK